MSSFSDRSPTWGAPERVHDPVAAFLLGELVAQLGANLVIGLADVVVSGGPDWGQSHPAENIAFEVLP